MSTPPFCAMTVLPGISGISVSSGELVGLSTQARTTPVVLQTANGVAALARGAGLKKLLDRSIPSAAFESPDRYLIPPCHPGTRDELVERLVAWGQNADNRAEDIAWVKGPACSGKTSVCQSAATRLGMALGASFFFSRYNRHSDPKLLFTTIAYQLADKYEPYGKLLDERILLDATILTASLSVQFRELIAIPIREAFGSGGLLSGKVIIVDGLNECEDPGYQHEILDIIIRSVIDKTTPFVWIVSSRPERRIISKFERRKIKRRTLQIEVTISRDLDQKIYHFLADKLGEIGAKHRLQASWPSEEDLNTLVNLSDGMFAYSHALSLFIDEDKSTSPPEQLRLVLDYAKRENAARGPEHHLTRLDNFYTGLIMERLPQERCDAMRSILFANYFFPQHRFPVDRQNRLTASEPWDPEVQGCARLLGYSEQGFELLCRFLRAVMFVDSKQKFKFYHSSFMDFLLDPFRSGRFCVLSTDCLVILLDLTMQALDDIQLDSALQPVPSRRLAWGVLSEENYVEQYYCLVVSFAHVLASLVFTGGLDEKRLTALREWDFRKLTLGQESYMGYINEGYILFDWKPHTPMELYKCLRKRGDDLIRGRPEVAPGFPGVLQRMKQAVQLSRFSSKTVFTLGQDEKGVELRYGDGNWGPYMTISASSSDSLRDFKNALLRKSIGKASMK